MGFGPRICVTRCGIVLCDKDRVTYNGYSFSSFTRLKKCTGHGWLANKKAKFFGFGFMFKDGRQGHDWRGERGTPTIIRTEAGTLMHEDQEGKEKAKIQKKTLVTI